MDKYFGHAEMTKIVHLMENVIQVLAVAEKVGLGIGVKIWTSYLQLKEVDTGQRIMEETHHHGEAQF